METIKTKNYEIRTAGAGGLTTIHFNEDLIQFVQCSYGFSPGFKYLSDITKGDKNSYKHFEGKELYEVDLPYGPDGGFILGKRIGMFRKPFVKLENLKCLLAVDKKVDEDARFGLAIDYISKINVALSGSGYMVALMNQSGRVLEVLDHLADEDCAYEAQKFLYDAALAMERSGEEFEFQHTEGM